MRSLRVFFALIITTILSNSLGCDRKNTSFSSQTGGPPAASYFTITPSTLDFQKVFIGTQFTKTFTINFHSGFQQAQSFTLGSAPSTISSNISQCVNLSDGGSCQVSLTYSPIDISTLPSSLTITANLTSTPSTLMGTLNLLGSGGQNQTPSSNDIPFFVGWFIYEPSSFVTLAQANATPAYSACLSAATIQLNSWVHGNQAIFCYETSGANGLVLNASPQNFTILTNYIVKNMGSSLQPTVQSLADIFKIPGTTSAFKATGAGVEFAQFFYMMAYLFIPQAIDLQNSAKAFNFTSTFVDDGIIILMNSNLVANQQNINQPFATPPLNSFLTSGSNTVVVLWVDDCCCGRALTNPSFNFQSSAIPVFNPYVITGYCYRGLTGIGIPGCTVNYTAQGARGSKTTDANGFYSIQSLPANVQISVTFSFNGQTSSAQVVTLDPHQAQTAAATINQPF